MNIANNPALFAALLPPPAAAAAATAWGPGDLFPGWTEDGTNITVPIAAFNNLTEALADATTGDSRQVLASICSTAFEWYNELVTKPEALTVAYRPGRVPTSGDFVGKQQAEFKITVYLDYPEGIVTAEPEA